jgi:hypothetical protein
MPIFGRHLAERGGNRACSVTLDEAKAAFRAAGEANIAHLTFLS